MTSTRYVYWQDEAPTPKEIRQVLEDYVRGIDESVHWTHDRFIVTLRGKHSYPFARVGPATDAQRAAAREQELEERVFEVVYDAGGLDIITRGADEITKVIANGFAKLCARGWEANET